VANFTANYDEITISNSPVLIVLDNSFEMTNFLHPCITSLCENYEQDWCFFDSRKKYKESFSVDQFREKN
jgi:hypothetical protein